MTECELFNRYIRLNCEYGYIQCHCILMSTAKAALKSAKEAFISGNHRETVQLCKKALKVDKNSYDAYLCGPPNNAVVAAAALLNAWRLCSCFLRLGRSCGAGCWERLPFSCTSMSRQRLHTPMPQTSVRAHCRPGRVWQSCTQPPGTQQRPRQCMKGWYAAEHASTMCAVSSEVSAGSTVLCCAAGSVRAWKACGAAGQPDRRTAPVQGVEARGAAAAASPGRG